MKLLLLTFHLEKDCRKYSKKTKSKVTQFLYLGVILGIDIINFLH